MANSAYTQWDNLRKALKNSKVGPNGKIATILMDCFIKLDGKLRVPLFRDKGLCQKSGEFYEMRKKLKDKGWLEFDTDANGKLIRYYPGKKLTSYATCGGITCHIYLQPNLFGGTTVISSWGTFDSNRGGHKYIFCDNGEEVDSALEDIKKTRLKRGYSPY